MTVRTLIRGVCAVAVLGGLVGCADEGVGTSASDLSRSRGGAQAGSDGGALVCMSDADCPGGEECEFEHGASFCKPHGGDDDQTDGRGSDDRGTDDDGTDDDGTDDNGTDGDGGCQDDDSPSDDAGVGDPSPTDPSAVCLSDADCAAGEECEFEHGTSFCKPHGGDDDR